MVDNFAFNNYSKIYKYYIKSITKSDSLPSAMYLDKKSASSDLDKARLQFESV